jgi:hypothetical protein
VHQFQPKLVVFSPWSINFYRNYKRKIENHILKLLTKSEWKTDQNQAVIDIEILLETIERLENKHWTWYFFSIIKKRTFEKYKKLDLDLSKPKLSNIVKRFKK